MKPNYLLVIFCTFFIFQLNAQHLEIGNKWIYDYRSVIGGGYFTEKFDSIEIVSDTLINNLNYYKLVATEESPCGIFLETEYLREEDGKIFRLKVDKSGDNLMIDFETSDSYNVNYESAWMSDFIETNVIPDSSGMETLPDGSTISVKYQRIINNSSFDDNTVYKLVDKVGYIQYGLLFPDIGTGLCDVEDFIRLRCFISSTDTIHVTQWDCHEPSMKVSTKEILVNEIAISPNPVNGQLLLPSDYDDAVVFNISGERVNLEIIDSTIDVSDLDAGFYIIHLKTKGIKTVSIAKFIKI